MPRKDYNYYKKPENIDLVAAYSGSSNANKQGEVFETQERSVEEVVEDIIKMSDQLELECGKDGDKGTKQWMAFKWFRNTLRDKYLTPITKNNMTNSKHFNSLIDSEESIYKPSRKENIISFFLALSIGLGLGLIVSTYIL